MKNTFFLISLLIMSCSIFSQDLIVTSEGDSINCKITKIKTENIYFTFKYETEIRNTLLPLEKVNTYQKNYYSTPDVPEGEVLGLNDYKKFRIAFNAGYSHQTAKISPNIDPAFRSYIQELKSGNHVGGDATFYFSESYGFGFKYYRFRTENTLNNIFIEENSGNIRTGQLRDDITINFIGPTFSSRIISKNKKNTFFFNSSIGYMGYTNNAIVIDASIITGNTLGIAFDMGYDIGLSDNISLGFQVAFFSGALSNYDVTTARVTQNIRLEPGEFESLHRLDFSVGLRFNK